MNIYQQPNTRKGFIIVITLILLLVMTTMGVGLFYSTKQTAMQVNISGSKTESLYTAESCITEAVHWLENNASQCQNQGLCTTINSNMDKGEWRLAGEDNKKKEKMRSKSYRCEVHKIKEINIDGGDGQVGQGKGFAVGQGEGYGAVATNTKSYYSIRSKGGNTTGKSNTIVEVIISMIL